MRHEFSEVQPPVLSAAFIASIISLSVWSMLVEVESAGIGDEGGVSTATEDIAMLLATFGCSIKKTCLVLDLTHVLSIHVLYTYARLDTWQCQLKKNRRNPNYSN